MFTTFTKFHTQWRGGGAGLDFNVFIAWMKNNGIEGEEFDQFLEDLAVIEQAAIAELRKK